MKFHIALQLYSIRDEMEKDFEKTLQKVKAFGYDGVEFAGLYGRSAVEVKKIIEEAGLIPVSAHVSFDALISAPEKVLGEYAEIGCKYVAIPYLTTEYRPGNDKFMEVIEGAKIIGEAAKTLGITLLYHNHDFEFEKIQGEYALDILYRTVSSDLLQTEIDTCWVNVAGENPADYVRKYAGRAPVVHLKDFAKLDVRSEVKQETSRSFEFLPLGLGVQNFPEILKACKDAGTHWVVVEQDKPSMEKGSMECALSSIEYLKKLSA